MFTPSSLPNTTLAHISTDTQGSRKQQEVPVIQKLSSVAAEEDLRSSISKSYYRCKQQPSVFWWVQNISGLCFKSNCVAFVYDSSGNVLQQGAKSKKEKLNGKTENISEMNYCFVYTLKTSHIVHQIHTFNVPLGSKKYF